MIDPNTALMTWIKQQWGAAIDTACESSSIPPAFLAALIANETGGNPHRSRFEGHVLAALWEVVLLRKAAYGSIGRPNILTYFSSQQVSVGNLPFGVTSAMKLLDDLATSWGLCQIMGYEVLPFQIDGVARLQDPATELPLALRMLAQFAQRNALDMTKDFDALFDCWNTGRPHAPTTDPQYIPNGLARMAIYKTLPSSGT